MKWLIERFKSAPEKKAFIHKGRIVTYGKVIELINLFHDRLNNSEIRMGDKVVVLGDYSPELFCLMLVLAIKGCIIIPLTKNSVVERSTALEISGCDWEILFSDDDIVWRYT